MFKPTSVCFSALSKRTRRVRVQILKDFPQFLLHKGEVTQVKPSLMRNYLHNYNGARYVLQDKDIDSDLLKSFEQIQKQLKSAKLGSKTTEEPAEAARPQVSESPLSSSPTPPQHQQTQPEETKPRSILEKDITVKDIKIPGLDL